MRDFYTLTKEELQVLRKKPLLIPDDKKGKMFDFSEKDIENAVQYLQTIFKGRVYRRFAANMLTLNQIYN